MNNVFITGKYKLLQYQENNTIYTLSIKTKKLILM